MKTTIRSFVLVLGMLIFAKSSVLIAQCNPTSDSLALVDLYKTTNGPAWTNTWDTLQPIINWYGVTLNAEGCISSLDLDGLLDPSDPTRSGGGNNLNGTITSNFWNLPQLTFLGLSGNSGLNYELPISIDNLSKLSQISLEASGLSGNIPAELGNISSLTYLDLSNNQLTGGVPSTMNNLNQLEVLWLYNNQLNGLPNLGGLINLRDLNLSNIIINDDFPNWIFDLDQLASLDLSNTQLTGTIDYDWSVLPALFNIRLKGNELNGPIPTSLGELAQLWQLDLSFNQLSGEIPTQLADFQHGYLSFNNNHLTGLIPNFSTGSSSLINLDVFNNQFSFEDILPYILDLETIVALGGSGNPADNYGYNAQQKIYKDTTILKALGDQLIIKLAIDDTVSTNVYQWFKYGQPLTTITGDNTLTINNIQASDLGIYTCEITNPSVPGLTLHTHNITLEESTCNIALTLGEQSVCDPRYNTYTQNITVTHSFDPFNGFLVVNGINYPNLPSPFTISLSGLDAGETIVDISAHFDALPSCSNTTNGFITAPSPCPEGVCDATDLILNSNEQSKNVYHARDNITSNRTMIPGNDIVFRAGESITLTDGFHAVANANFVAEIMPCDLAAFQENPIETPPISAVDEVIPELKILPNPFHDHAKIQYQLTTNQTISLNMYTMSGHLVQQFEQDTPQKPGNYDYMLYANHLKGGFYILVLKTEEAIQTKKVILVE